MLELLMMIRVNQKKLLRSTLLKLGEMPMLLNLLRRSLLWMTIQVHFYTIIVSFTHKYNSSKHASILELKTHFQILGHLVHV